MLSAPQCALTELSMSFVMCPENGYPRLWRYVGPGVLPEGVLSTYDEKQNLVVINKELYYPHPRFQQPEELPITEATEVHKKT